MTAVFALKKKAQRTDLTTRTFLLTIKSRLLFRVAGSFFFCLSTFVFERSGLSTLLLNHSGFDTIALQQSINGRFATTETFVQIHRFLCSALL